MSWPGPGVLDLSAVHHGSPAGSSPGVPRASPCHSGSYAPAEPRPVAQLLRLLSPTLRLRHLSAEAVTRLPRIHPHMPRHTSVTTKRHRPRVVRGSSPRLPADERTSTGCAPRPRNERLPPTAAGGAHHGATGSGWRRSSSSGCGLAWRLAEETRTAPAECRHASPVNGRGRSADRWIFETVSVPCGIRALTGRRRRTSMFVSCWRRRCRAPWRPGRPLRAAVCLRDALV